MRSLRALVLVLGSLSAGIASGTVSAGSTLAQDPTPAPGHAAVDTASRSNPRIWVGRHAEFEECLKNAEIDRSEQVPIGVTKPTRLVFKAGRPCAAALFSSQPPSRATGYLESHLHRIAAYEVDKLVGLDMVPPTVLRRAEGKEGSAQLWIDNVVTYNSLKGQNAPDAAEWNRQVRQWRVFDNLIADIDRNAGNILVLRDPNWHLVLVDHSRAFTNTSRMVLSMEYIDRPFYERLKALDKAALDARVGKLVLDGSRSILQRRDAIVAQIEKLVKARGEATVITP
jgi:hypothetical protein